MSSQTPFKSSYNIRKRKLKKTKKLGIFVEYCAVDLNGKDVDIFQRRVCSALEVCSYRHFLEKDKISFLDGAKEQVFKDLFSWRS